MNTLNPITPVSPEQFAAMVAKLTTTNQATIAYTSGSTSQGVITGHGVTANFAYDTASQTLNRYIARTLSTNHPL